MHIDFRPPLPKPDTSDVATSQHLSTHYSAHQTIRADKMPDPKNFKSITHEANLPLEQKSEASTRRSISEIRQKYSNYKHVGKDSKTIEEWRKKDLSRNQSAKGI